MMNVKKYGKRIITLTKFQALESLDGGIDMGMGNTAFVGTDTHTIDTLWNATDIDTTTETNEDADPITTSDIPKNLAK